MNITILPYYTEEQIVEKLRDLIGQTYSENVLEIAKARTLRETRPSGPGYITTKDFYRGRVNLMVDDEQIIRGIQFG